MAGSSWPGSPSTRPSAPPAPFSFGSVNLGSADSDQGNRENVLVAQPQSMQHVAPGHGVRQCSTMTGDSRGVSSLSGGGTFTSSETGSGRLLGGAQVTKLLKREKVGGDNNRERRQPLFDCNTRRDDVDSRGKRPHSTVDSREVSNAENEAGIAGTAVRGRTIAEQVTDNQRPIAPPSNLATQLRSRVLEHVSHNGSSATISVPRVRLPGTSESREGGPTSGPVETGQPLEEVQNTRLVVPADSATLPWWQEAYQINWRPKRFAVKLRQQMQGFRIGANCEFQRSEILRQLPEAQSPQQKWSDSLCGFDVNTAAWKMVLKPSSGNLKWKVIYEPQRQDVRFISRKICLGKWLKFQVGFGHDFKNNATGLKWRLSPALVGPTPSKPIAVQHKTTFPICHGLDVRAGWSAQYSLPDIHGSRGTGEPPLGLNVGQLSVSVDRVEAIFTNHL